jgi:hypothetical protein
MTLIGLFPIHEAGSCEKVLTAKNYNGFQEGGLFTDTQRTVKTIWLPFRANCLTGGHNTQLFRAIGVPIWPSS